MAKDFLRLLLSGHSVNCHPKDFCRGRPTKITMSDADLDSELHLAADWGKWTRIVSETPSKSFRGGGQKYELLNLLGEGSYGSVYQSSRVSDGANFAVKIVDPRKMAFAAGSVGAIHGLELLINREVETLQRVSAHPGIVTIEEVMWSAFTRQTFIVTELVPGETLFPVVFRRTSQFMEPEIAHIAAQVSNALAFCHRQRIAHRDIKLENVLVASINVDLVPDQAGAWQTCELYDVKLCDFGLAKILQGTNTTRTAVGTSAYLAPEIKADADCQYDAMKADTYSFGVMAFVMLCLGFPGKEGTQCAYWNHKNWLGLSSQAKSFASSILEPNPLDRFSMTQALGHQWLAEAQEKLDDNLKHYEVEGDSEGDTCPGTGATCNTVVVDSTGPDTGSTTDANRSSRREVGLDKSLARDSSSSSPTVRRKLLSLPKRKLSLVDENCPTEYPTTSTDKYVSCSVESRPVNENCAKASACSGAKVDGRCEVGPVSEVAGVDEVLATRAASSSQCGCRQGLKLILQNIVDRL